MPREFLSPREFTSEELSAYREEAEGLFRAERREEGPKVFAAVCAEVEPLVRNALAVTGDLRAIDAAALTGDPYLWRVLRYMCAPPVSEEDLWTLVGRKFKAMPADVADDTAEAIADVIDPVRFPWVDDSRDANASERDAAVLATTALLAHETLRTRRRGEASQRQEAEVAAALDSVGFQRVEDRDPIVVMDELPRGAYSRERKIAGAKCDIPIRLYDGRLLAVECKVSNGPKNSWKRLIREVGGKAELWRGRFGTQALTGAVLAGVYDLSCLANAQKIEGVWLFWQHDFSSLLDFVTNAR